MQAPRMDSMFRRTLCIVGSFFAMMLARATDVPAPAIWSFDNLTTLGGTPLELWGAPVLSTEKPTPAVRFDGKADGLLVPGVPIAGWKNFTVEILFSPDPDGLPEQRFLHLEDEKGRRVLIELRLLPDGQWCLDTFLYSDAGHRLTLIDRTKTHPAGRWYWAAVSYADGRMTHFVEAVKECEGAIQFEPMGTSGRTSLGVRQNKVSWFKGAIREVRFTPATLTAEMLQRVGDK
jgi:hypothetical protein